MAGQLSEEEHAARRSQQRDEMMVLLKQLWSKPISLAEPGGDGARNARMSYDDGGVPVSPRPEEVPVDMLRAGSATGQQVADMARKASGRLRAKSVFARPSQVQ